MENETKKKRAILTLILLIIIINSVLLTTLNRPDKKTLTALSIFISRVMAGVSNVATSIGRLFLIVSRVFTITIDSPENKTYTTRVIDLNVSADTDIQAWWYNLVRVSNSEIVRDNISFTSNTTILAVRGWNFLTVYGNDSAGQLRSNNVTFNVSIINNPPVIDSIPNLYACEDTSFSHFFNVTDTEEDSISLFLSPSDPFYVRNLGRTDNTTGGEIFSASLNKADTGLHQELIWAIDGNLADYERFNVSVIEINHAPNIENVSVMTFYSNSSIYLQVNVSDIEHGNSSSGNFTFNLSFLNGTSFFSINESYGIINKSLNSTHIGNYLTRICVSDRGLANPHENISICNETSDNKSACIQWQFSVVIFNHAPNITNYSNSITGKNLSLTIQETQTAIFNVTVEDEDGTTPSVSWYLDSVLVKSEEANYSGYVYTPSVGDAGEHNLTVIASDGIANDSLIWNITVNEKPPEPAPAGGIGGGGAPAAKVVCEEKWGCGSWSICQLFSQLSDDERKKMAELCSEAGIPKEKCGFQVRTCIDAGYCKTEFKKPAEIQACYYVAIPSCDDDILNCHNGSCEIMVDCGGPCKPCPTCSDGIKNQDEEGIDCGGPCPPCPEEIPKKREIRLIYFVIIAIMILFGFLIYRIREVIRFKKRARMIRDMILRK